MINIPLLDLKSQYTALKDEISVALQEVLDSSAFASGPAVARFEKNFSKLCQTEFAVAVNSGTTALWAALIGLGIGPGDEVITSANTFIATAEAISFAGATPVFVDIDPETFTLDPALLEDAITSKTKAIIPVHMYGQMAAMDPIMEVGSRNDLAVIEDACQAHASEYNGKRAGSIGNAGCFSFYPGKNLGAYGEGGAITTNSESLAEFNRIFRDHGQVQKYHHSIIGFNGRMDGFQGAVLNVKLKYLEEWTEARRRHAQRYNTLLKDVDGLITPIEKENNRHVYHIYAVQLKNRDNVLSRLTEHGINCGIHYPVPIHLQKAYAALGYKKGDLPKTESIADTLLSLPIFPELTKEQITYITDTLKKVIQDER